MITHTDVVVTQIIVKGTDVCYTVITHTDVVVTQIIVKGTDVVCYTVITHTDVVVTQTIVKGTDDVCYSVITHRDVVVTMSHRSLLKEQMLSGGVKNTLTTHTEVVVTQIIVKGVPGAF